MIRTDSSDWQPNLIGLLARLEHIRSELAGRRLADALAVVDVAERIVLAADDLAARTPFPDDSLPLQAEAVARAGVFFTAAVAIKRSFVPKPKGLLRSVLSALGEEAAGVDVKAVRDCLTDAVEALHGYFGLFTDRFPSSTLARGWVDAATAYLVDFKQQIKSLPDY